MSDHMIHYLIARGEALAAGFCELPGASPVRRFGRAQRRWLEHCPLAPFAGEPLYPAGSYSVWGRSTALRFHYSYPFNFDQEAWTAYVRACPDPALREQMQALGAELAGYPLFTGIVPPEFRLGGNGYTHSVIAYERVVAEGLERYAERLNARQRQAEAVCDAERADLYYALQDLLAGMRTYHARILSHVRASSPRVTREDLLRALEHVPWQPARTFYEGLVAVNWLYYLDGCDNLGRFDQVLGALYEADLDAGRITEAEGERLVRRLWQNVDDNDGWNTTLGGSTREGEPAYNRLTVSCLHAAWHMRRPNLALRVRPDMPQAVWDAALDTLASGCGLPALYNEGAYQRALHRPGLLNDRGDLSEFAFGGCTETMVHGKSNVGSLDAGMNALCTFTHTLSTALSTAPRETSFAALLDAYKRDLAREVARLTGAVSQLQQVRAQYHPQLVRTLLVDDCLERGLEFNAGGARYNWSVINVGGLANVIDSLAAIREVVFDKGEVDGATLWQALQANFQGYEGLRERLTRCPRYGNDDPAADDLADELSFFIFQEFARYTPWRGGRFLPGCLMFVRYADAGKGIMATPDGRFAGDPIADSAGPVAGRDRHGPTAMIRSVSRLDVQGAPGTLVVNMRLDQRMLRGPEARTQSQALIRTYFALGNMQLQINVVEQATLEAALADPDAYRDLIVRVAGYSEYFYRLTPELRRTVLERTIHAW